MELTTEMSLALSLISLVLATIFLIVIITTFSKVGDQKVSVIKIVLCASLVAVNLIRQEWFLTALWGINLILNLTLNFKFMEFVKWLIEPKVDELGPPYDTVGTNCPVCDAKNEYPVDGMEHYCIRCGSQLPKAR